MNLLTTMPTAITTVFVKATLLYFSFVHIINYPLILKINRTLYALIPVFQPWMHYESKCFLKHAVSNRYSESFKFCVKVIRNKYLFKIYFNLCFYSFNL